MDTTKAEAAIERYLKRCIYTWVDRSNLRGAFTSYQIDIAISKGWLKPLAPGMSVKAEDELYISTDESPIYTIHM